MEKSSRCCTNCQQPFLLLRNLKQQYCDQGLCQNVRKREWRKQKKAHDTDYRQNQRSAEQRWRQRNADYWKQYRATHPDYAKRNREQQRLRQQQRRRLDRANTHQTVDASQFANSDALRDTSLIKQPVKSGIYRMIPATHPEFANSDALLVTIAIVTIS
jgi:hypothetical protein